MKLPAVCDIRAVIKEAIKLAHKADKDGDFEKAKFFWRRATNAANAIADIDKDDPRWESKCNVSEQIFNNKVKIEKANSKIENAKLNVEKTRILADNKRIKEEQDRKIFEENERRKEENEARIKMEKEQDKKEHIKWIINKNKKACEYIESRLEEKKDILHLVTVRQIGKYLLSKGNIESYRAYKVLHSSARMAVVWYNYILFLKDDQREIDKVADLIPVNQVIDFLKREIVLDSTDSTDK